MKQLLLIFSCRISRGPRFWPGARGRWPRPAPRPRRTPHARLFSTARRQFYRTILDASVAPMQSFGHTFSLEKIKSLLRNHNLPAGHALKHRDTHQEQNLPLALFSLPKYTCQADWQLGGGEAICFEVSKFVHSCIYFTGKVHVRVRGGGCHPSLFRLSSHVSDETIWSLLLLPWFVFGCQHDNKKKILGEMVKSGCARSSFCPLEFCMYIFDTETSRLSSQSFLMMTQKLRTLVFWATIFWLLFTVRWKKIEHT